MLWWNESTIKKMLNNKTLFNIDNMGLIPSSIGIDILEQQHVGDDLASKAYKSLLRKVP